MRDLRKPNAYEELPKAPLDAWPPRVTGALVLSNMFAGMVSTGVSAMYVCAHQPKEALAAGTLAAYSYISAALQSGIIAPNRPFGKQLKEHWLSLTEN